MNRALCVGCNYPSKAAGLSGAVNDAFLLASVLKEEFDMDDEDVIVLHDVMPGERRGAAVPPEVNPTRHNILNHLSWLLHDARTGDSLFFSFSGYGLQVDDLNGYQDDGYDEAILPTDYVNGRDGDCAVIVAEDMADIFTSVPPGCTLTIVLDCDHTSTAMDAAGSLEGKSSHSLKLQSVLCGMMTRNYHTELLTERRDFWRFEDARAFKARPRFHPILNIVDPRRGNAPHRGNMARTRPLSFCYGASKFGQTSLELQLPKIDRMGSIIDESDKQSHGVLTWCFVRAFASLHFDCTHIELLAKIREEMHNVRKVLRCMDQEVTFSYSRPASEPHRMKVFQGLSKAYINSLPPWPSRKRSLREYPSSLPTSRRAEVPSATATNTSLIYGDDFSVPSSTRTRDINLSSLVEDANHSNPSSRPSYEKPEATQQQARTSLTSSTPLTENDFSPSSAPATAPILFNIFGLQAPTLRPTLMNLASSMHKKILTPLERTPIGVTLLK